MVLHKTRLRSGIERNIWSYEVKEAIANGEIIEDYPSDKYAPSLLILGWTRKRRPLHIQCAYPSPERKIRL